MASFQRSRKTRSFQSGMMLPSGQPVWQNGTPQSMQRAPWVRTFSSAKSRYTSDQSLIRSRTGRRSGVSRPNSTKPVTLPMRDLSRERGHRRWYMLWRRNRYSGCNLKFRDAEHSLKFVREHFDELGQQAVPVLENPLPARAAGGFDMFGNQVLEHLLIAR